MFGFGGDWDDPPSPTFRATLERIASTGDPVLLRQYLSGISIQSGETGVVPHNYLLTDWYRRTFIKLLPLDHPVRQNLAGLFEPTPTQYLPAARAAAWLGAIESLNQQYGRIEYDRESAIRGLVNGNVGHTVLNLTFRPAWEVITREQAERMVPTSFGSVQSLVFAGWPALWKGI